MPSNHTDKYHLSQWEKSDKVLMEDFNRDNRNIENALAAKAEQSAVDELSNTVAATLPEIPKVALGTYQGTGTYGADKPTVVTFPFQPKLAVVMAGGIYAVFLQGVTSAQMRNGNVFGSYTVKWEGATMSWYITSATWGSANYGLSAGLQMNGNNGTYTYFIIG